MSKTTALAATSGASTSSTIEMASTSNQSVDSVQSLHPLVTQKLVETEKYYCPFLERGFCRNATKCNFSHDSQTAIKIPTDFCHFYLANQCLYAQDCKFIHGEPIENPINPIDEAATMLHNINLTNDNRNFDNHEVDQDDEQYTTLHDYSYDYAELATPDAMVNANDYNYYNQQQQQFQHLELSNIQTGDSNTKHDYNHQVSNYSEPEATTSYANQSKYNKTIAPTSSSSSNYHDNTKLKQLPNNADNVEYIARNTSSSPLPPPATTAHERLRANFQPLRAIVAGDPSSSSSGSGYNKSSTSRPATSRIIDSSEKGSSSTTKAWQGGRLLASLKGESSSVSNHYHYEEHLKQLPLCPYSMATGGCPYPEGRCTYLHGQICDLCCVPCLHPYDEAQQRQHRDDCLREHEREMELSFAVQRSKDKICGICMDTVVEKKPVTSSRFGILEKCNHIFCLDCIRKWRGTKQFDSKTIRACPECRVNSDFVVPSKYWVEDQDDKEKLIHDYKAALRSKPCRYFNEGKGECPFAGSCFYKHAYPDGRLAELEAPKPRRRLYGARGTTTLTNYVLWSLIRSFEDDEDWSDDAESNSHFYIQDEDEDDNDDEDEDDDNDDDLEDDDDQAIHGADIRELTTRNW